MRRLSIATLSSFAVACAITAGAPPSGKLSPVHPGAEQDATEILQQALDGDAAEVVLTPNGGDWLTGPLFVRRDGLRLTLAPGTVLRGLSGAFPGREDALLTVEKRSNFTLIAHSARLVMPRADFTEGEHRHCLNLRSVERVRVHGGEFAGSGGDGIYLGTRDGRRTNDDIVITDVVCRSNRRQGMSVTCASRLVIRDCLFIDTAGTPPEAGLDFEPNHEADFFTACVVSDCLAIHNAAQGFENHFNRLRAASRPIELLFEHCYAEGGAKYGFTILASDARHPPPPGRLVLKNGIARHNGTAGIRTRNGGTGGLRAEIEDCLILHPGTTDKRAPLWMLAQDGTIAPHGDAAFRNLRIVDDQPRAPALVSLQGSAADHGLGSFEGDLTVLGPHSSTLSESTAKLLPDLNITLEKAATASLELSAPTPGSPMRRGDEIPLAIDTKLPPETEGWRIRFEVRHNNRIIAEQETAPNEVPQTWTTEADLPAGLYSLWFTLTDSGGRVHDVAATAVVLTPL